MNVQRADRIVHILSILGIWLAFLVGWMFSVGMATAWAFRRGDVPASTALYFELPAAWMALVCPTIFTILIIWLIRSRSVHLNWVVGSLLLASLTYSAFAQFAAVLPAYSLCGAIGGCQT